MLLRRASANLLANAVHYADAPSTIVLSSRVEGSSTTVVVENAGRPSRQSSWRLFGCFIAPARPDSSQSSVLGLAIVHTIMVLHGGSAQAESKDGVNRFFLHFPKELSIKTI